MPYLMHRIFCATPSDLEEERQAFYTAMGEFNQNQAMPLGILFVSVSLIPNVTDKRGFQGAISENIRACRYYIQVLEDGWGPPERNFERDYALATKCAADPNLPMQEVAVLFKKPLLPHRVEPEILELKQSLETGGGQLHADFDAIEEFQDRLCHLLAGWLRTVTTPAATA